jgi:dienelactone hydrolase
MNRNSNFIVGILLWTHFLVMALPTYAETTRDTSRGERMIAAYFKNETEKLAKACLADVKTLEDWSARRETYRQQLREMLGLDPMPERTPLNAVVTGTLEHPEFLVEKLHFQSRPHLYVTANLYLPKNRKGPAPAVLYVCGHGGAKIDGVSYGNKTTYQHHGAWFARHGYVCLIIDTVQLGEIEGIHHGTYRENMWWWNARSYTPAGVEAWNAIRALDYLESRPAVDRERLGVTGRSGGGAYSWWLAALDDRVKAAVPVAGITNLENHVVDGCVEGHCDCMYLVNTHRWDYAQVAALVAPRPLLIANSDRDTIFPLDGVLDVHGKVRQIYDLYDRPERLGLNITAGGHDDTQPLQVHAFAWFNEHLKHGATPISAAAEPFFEVKQLKVFDKLPPDEINTRIHESFVAQAPPPAVAESAEEWKSQAATWRRLLLEKAFGGWPVSDNSDIPTGIRKVFQSDSGGITLNMHEFNSQEEIKLRLYIVSPAGISFADLESIELQPLDEKGWNDFLAAMHIDFAGQLEGEEQVEPDEAKFAALQKAVESKRHAVAFIAPRGIGPTAWDPKKEIHIRRRFMLLGQTLDGMRVWDVRRAIQTLRALDGLAHKSLSLKANGNMAGMALYAAIFEPGIHRLKLHDLPKSHMEGPDFLNVLRFLDVPQTVAMVAENSHIVVRGDNKEAWAYPAAVADKLDWKNNVTIEVEDPISSK